MDKRRLAVLVLAILLPFLSGCEGETARRPYALELQAEADAAQERARAVAAQETAQAQATRQSQDVAMRATTDSLNAQAQATRQTMDAQATAQALSVQATRQAQDLEATRTAEARNAQATATAQVQNERATATAASATATMQAAIVAVEGTAQAAQAISAQATAQAVERQAERERMTQPLRTFGPWALLLAGLVALALVGWKAWTLFEDRARLVRRGPDEGEPLMLITRERLALPLRQFGPYADMTHRQERAPLLAPTAEVQEGATTRQQVSNAILAPQAGKIAEAKGQGPQKILVLPPGKRSVSKTRQKRAPGLGRVVAVRSLEDATRQGILPPGLAQAIEGQWEAIDDDG